MKLFCCCSSSVQDFLRAKEMEFDDDEYNENRIMPPPKSLNRMDEDWDTDDGQFAMGFEDDMEDEDLENMDNIEAMEPLLLTKSDRMTGTPAIFVFHLQNGESKQVGLGSSRKWAP